MQELKSDDTVNHRYKVVRKLGAGAMGSVYLCEDVVENSTRVALKVLNSTNVEGQDEWAKGEYEALTRLRHPNLARVYNFGRIGKTRDYFIVSEFIKGVDLYSATEYVNYEELNEILVQTCRALEYIHSRGYIHFDVKPDNILVTRHKTFGLQEGSKVLQEDSSSGSSSGYSVFSTPSIKLIDFGLAERITGSFSYVIKGTLNYLAPEIVSGKTPDHRADLYSLGVSLYQITNRELPHQLDDNEFHSTSIQDMRRSDLFEIHMKKHPEYLRKTILNLLEEDPSRRFQSAREVIRFLSEHSGKQYEVETKETQKSYLHSTRMVGRKKEIHLLKKLCEGIFSSQKSGDGEKEPALVPEDLDERDSEDTNDVFGDELLDEIRAEAAPQKIDLEYPAMVWVTGEMGIGKSRILEEFQHYLRLNDIQLHSGNCYEGTSNAYQPFLEILREMVYGLGLHSKTVDKYRQVLLRLLPEVREKASALDREGKDVSLAPDQERIFFIDRITRFLIDVADDRPYVLILNNLHWADEVTVELLETLVERIKEFRQKRSLKLLLVCSLRIDEQYSESFKRFLSRNREDSFCREIPLRRLKRSQTVELLQSMLGFTEVPTLFLDRIEEKTGGNPLFIQETLKALQDEGTLRQSAGGWQIKTTSYNRVEIPHSLEELLLQRILRLEPIKREILEVMSVLNRPISPKVLQKFKRFEDLPILTHLRDLEQSGLLAKVFEGGKLTFQIDQPKMREILYSNLEEGVRRKYHGEVGEFFAAVYQGHEEEILEDLAYHYQRSDLLDRSLEMSFKAGDRLKAIYANERALEFYVYIVESLEEVGPEVDLLIEAREKIGELCTTMGKYDTAEASYDSLLDIDSRFSLSPGAVARCFRKKGKIFEIQGDYDTALRCYKDARNHLSSIQDPELLDERIRVFNSIGWVYVCMGKYEKAMAISVEALRVIEGLTEKIEHAMIFSTIGSANNYKGQFNRAIEFHTRSLKIHENLENIPEMTVCLNNLGKACLASADYGEAWEHFRRALKNSQEIGDPFGRATSLHNLAWLYFLLGRLGQAEAYLEDSLQLTRDYNIRNLNTENYLLYGRIKREQSDFSRAESHLFRALTSYSKQGNRWGLCTTLLEIVAIHRLKGSHVEALTMVDEAERYALSLDITLLKCRCVFERSRVLRDSGGVTGECLDMFQEALVLVRNLEVPELQAEIQREIGDLLVRERRLEEAKQQYSKAEDRLREILERLPGQLQEFYREKHRDHFQLEGSVVILDKSEKPEGDNSRAEKSSAPVPILEELPRVSPKKKRTAAGDAVDCMNELLRILKNSSSLEGFLKVVLRRVLDLSRARSAFVLARQGDQLHIRGSLYSDRSRCRDPQQLLALGLIEKVLKSQESVVVQDMIRDPLIGDLGGLIKQGARSLIVLPYEGVCENGVLYFVDPVPTSGVLKDDMPFYDFLANLLPLAILHLDEPVATE